MGSLKSELQRIYEAKGRLTPALVVEEAKDPASPLHDRFEWDDTEAARRYRLEQGAELIRSVKIRYRSPEGKPRDLRAFVSTRSMGSGPSSYTPVEEAMADPVTRRIILADMNREWRAFRKRYEHMAEFSDLIAAEAAEQASKAG